jgi:hypothetical protein
MRKQRDNLKTEFIIKKEAEQKELENPQPGCIVVNESVFKGIAEQLIAKEISIDREWKKEPEGISEIVESAPFITGLEL